MKNFEQRRYCCNNKPQTVVKIKNSTTMDKTNAWNSIPLADYEQHMQHGSVAQAQLLNALTKKYLQKHHPESVLFLGISGGNGLEHIDINKTKTVYGIDVNQSYLDETKKRFGEKIGQL